MSIQIIDSFLTEEQCQYIINTYKDKLVPSRVVIDGKSADQHPSRTSSTFFLPGNDRVVLEIKRRAAEYLNVPMENFEGLQLLRYQKGERYLYHHDFIAGNPPNQREHTIIAYLNDLKEEDGGATSFFHYKQKVQPKTGRGVWFRNMDAEGNLINESLHAGEEIKTDVIKYAINIWSRKKKY
jgi:prolyl 4-hydroxylase